MGVCMSKQFVLPMMVVAMILAGCAGAGKKAEESNFNTLPPTPEKAARASGPPAPTTDGIYGQPFDFVAAKEINAVIPTVRTVKLQTKKNKVGPEIIMKAKVSNVCPKKGCWMQVASKKGDLRVTFFDYGFFVPVELVGREVAMYGNFVVHKESVGEQKHLLADAQRPKEEIDAVKTEREGLRFIARGVKDLSVGPAY